MTEVAERVMARLDLGPPEFDPETLTRFIVRWSIVPPEELVRLWMRYGSGDGYAGPDGTGEYIVFYSLAGVLARFKDYERTPPPGMAPLGTNGGDEMIVYVEGRGYGLIEFINGGADDLVFVAETLEGFFEKSESGTWYGDEGEAT